MTTTETTPEVDTARVGYIDGLRQLADLLEQHDELKLPYEGSSETYSRLSVFVDTKEQVAAYARGIPGRVDKQVDNGSSHFGFELRGSIAGLHLTVYAPRGEVCERVVTGVETVVEQVPDPDALAAVPTVEVTREVETVEWVCSPLLAESVTA